MQCGILFGIISKEVEGPRASGLGWEIQFSLWKLLSNTVPKMKPAAGRSKPTAKLCWVRANSELLQFFLPMINEFSKAHGGIVSWLNFCGFVSLLYVKIQESYLIHLLSFPNSCWLHVDNYFIWSFIGPVTFIILVSRLTLTAFWTATVTVAPKQRYAPPLLIMQLKMCKHVC